MFERRDACDDDKLERTRSRVVGLIACAQWLNTASSDVTARGIVQNARCCTGEDGGFHPCRSVTNLNIGSVDWVVSEPWVRFRKLL